MFAVSKNDHGFQIVREYENIFKLPNGCELKNYSWIQFCNKFWKCFYILLKNHEFEENIHQFRIQNMFAIWKNVCESKMLLNKIMFINLENSMNKKNSLIKNLIQYWNKIKRKGRRKIKT